MGITEDLRSFINKYRVEKGKQYTNTSIGHPKVSLYIPDEKYNDFINIYSLAITNGIPMYFTEKPLNPSPLRVDLDFRFLMPENKTGIYDSTDSDSSFEKPKKYNRLYTENDIYTIINTYFSIINKYIDIDEKSNIAYIMEKPHPTEHRNKLKDGLHIVFPHIIVENNVQHFIRRKILDVAKDMFKELPVCNDHESIIDKAIIDVNSWQMYASKKPDCETYRVSLIYQYINNETIKDTYTINAADEINFIKLFSMRNQGNKETNVKIFAEYEAEVKEYVKHVLPAVDIKQKTKIHNNIFAKSLNINKNYVSEDELILTKKLVHECLSFSRAENYQDWINLGWVLRNIDYRLLDTWVEFSKISSSYIEGECQVLWNKMRKDNMGMGTLRWWAKQDDIIKYHKIIDESIIPLIDICIRSDGAHYDVAKVVHAQYKDEFISITRDIWYRYDKNKHRWVKSREGLDLRLIFSQVICSKFIERSQYYMSAHTTDQFVKNLNDELAKKSIKIAQQLKNASYKDSIMKECRTLFIDDTFEEMLDSRTHLLGFDNGVYDLKMHMFRDGMPDDYIYHSTKINYVTYNPECNEIAEINDFFSKIFINEGVRNYVLDIIACIIDGSIAQERFYIFTGQGSNGKSRLLDFIQKAVGDYYCILPISLLTQKRVASNSAQGELERTKGRRFAVMQEPSEQDRLNIGLMKELSGNDRILTRGLYKEPTEFKPQFKMILTCNELPEVPSDDGGTWRRIRVIEFLSKFCDNPTKPNEFNMDLGLSDKFDRWADIFMSMLIERHKTINPNALHEPMEVRIATESYKLNNDVIGQFFSEAIEVVDDPNCRIILSKLYGDFRIWAMNNVSKGKKLPDRNQIKAYFEKNRGPYPPDGKGWKCLKIKAFAMLDDDEIEEPIV